MTVQQLEQATGIIIPTIRSEAVAALGGQHGARNTVNKEATNGGERHENRRYFKGRVAIHLVRDEGVAGSNPATPTSFIVAQEARRGRIRGTKPKSAPVIFSVFALAAELHFGLELVGPI